MTEASNGIHMIKRILAHFDPFDRLRVALRNSKGAKLSVNKKTGRRAGHHRPALLLVENQTSLTVKPEEKLESSPSSNLLKN